MRAARGTHATTLDTRIAESRTLSTPVTDRRAAAHTDITRPTQTAQPTTKPTIRIYTNGRPLKVYASTP